MTALLATLPGVAFLKQYFGEWKPISRYAGIGWLCFYLLFLAYAARDGSGFLFLDYANLMIHEAGHPFFSWFGYTIMILGGTLAELIVPLLCAGYFFWKREISGTAFCGFWFFENFPYIGTYMADARAQALPLVGSGDHDWAILFGQWGLLLQDRKIGGAMRTIGWLGMIAALGWLAWRTYRSAREDVSAHAAEQVR
ncbi:MAG TPA: hypothetical protein VKQ28_03230 [Candidatus Acidoferrum sp.]|nr:hypothetical protein [Candidatus Acidoferrum sp.]